MNVIRKIIRPQTCQYIFPRFRSSDIYEPPYLSVSIKIILKYFNLHDFFVNFRKWFRKSLFTIN